MKVQPFIQTPVQTVPNAEGVTIRWVIGKDDGAPNFAMRVIEVEAGCNTPYHTHDFEHEVYVLSGTGVVREADGSEKPIEEGSVVYVPPDEKHGFFNRGNDMLRFVCVVPHVDK